MDSRPASTRAGSTPLRPTAKSPANAPFRESHGAPRTIGRRETIRECSHAPAQGARKFTLGLRQFPVTAEDGHMTCAVGCAAAARVGQAALAVGQADQIHAVMQKR